MELICHSHITKSRTFNIRPIGDLQEGEAGFRKDLWKKWKQDTMLDRDSLIIGMGDYSDKFRTTISNKLQGALLGDDSATMQFDEMLMSEMQHLSDELKPFRHRIIGLHCGHHHHKLYTGSCTCQYLCQLLRVKHLGFVAMTCLSVNRCGSISNITIFSTHGCGGASTVASDLTNLERKIMPFWDADLFIRGHSTRAFVAEGNPISYLYKKGESLSIKNKKRVLVNAGGFMEGYTIGNQSYVERSNMPRINLGWCVINVHLPSSKDELFRITGKAETF